LIFVTAAGGAGSTFVTTSESDVSSCLGFVGLAGLASTAAGGSAFGLLLLQSSVEGFFAGAGSFLTVGSDGSAFGLALLKSRVLGFFSPDGFFDASTVAAAPEPLDVFLGFSGWGAVAGALVVIHLRTGGQLGINVKEMSDLPSRRARPSCRLSSHGLVPVGHRCRERSSLTL